MEKINTIWNEHYRPSKVDDCVLPDDLRTTFKSFVDKNEIPNLLFVGKPGMGKTTIAKALCKELNCDTMIINGSEENGIGVLRNKIKSFASTVSLLGGKKVVIIDEADYLEKNSTMPAMRSFLEEYSKNCRFILTANYKGKIIEPLLSRLTIIEFAIPVKQKQQIAKNIIQRICFILKSENVEFDKQVVAQGVVKFFPDFRKTISEMQKYVIAYGKLDVGFLSLIEDIGVKELMTCLKQKNFSGMRKWVTENLDNDPTWVVRTIFDNMENYLEKASIPQAILILADFSYKAAFVADMEILMSSMLINLMAEIVFLD